jgi:type II secretory ATPase GspE/PulE/Tfp pilus assembly ATPase PilB-like protein
MATKPLQNDSQRSLTEVVATASQNELQFATEFVRALLRQARDVGASDVHLNPTGDALIVRQRLDGVLQPLVELPRAMAPNVIARMKVLAGLLTYETVRPQEGRIRDDGLFVEVRVSTFPTLHGERAVLRLLGASNPLLESLSQLGLPPAVEGELEAHLAATSGGILIVGPAGSGKTTTAYACLRQIVTTTAGSRSIASLEDPVEVALDGVAQSQVNPGVEFDMANGLRSLLRLDPEVIFIGEIRDRATAEVALQAALTGQLVVTTFHAGNCDDALHRLIEIGIPAYAVRNAVRLIVAQRLVRKLCTCARPADAAEHANPLGMNVAHCAIPGSCDDCQHTGYRGRALIAEWRSAPDFDRPGAPLADGPLWAAAEALIVAGVTSPAEVVRVLGIRRALAVD